MRMLTLVSLMMQGEQALRGRPISAGPLLKTIDGFAASVAEKCVVNGALALTASWSV
jgi:hypothetical protein